MIHKIPQAFKNLNFPSLYPSLDNPPIHVWKKFCDHEWSEIKEFYWRNEADPKYTLLESKAPTKQ